MKVAGPIIYCIEGHWGYGPDKVEPSVEPALDLLRRLDLWPYVRRDCATSKELKYWIKSEWNQLEYGSILYFATHGAKGKIWLSESQGTPIAKIADSADCSKSWVHFGGCNVLSSAEGKVEEFMRDSGATVVSGYTKDAGWTDVTVAYPPTLALELILFSSAATKGVKFWHSKSRQKLEEISEDLKGRFPDCGFELYTKESIGL